MNRFELIEKLRERADINYEEADQLLSDTQDDLIAALIILEKKGRLKGMQQGRPGRTSGTDDVRTEAGTKKSKRSVIGHAFRTFGNFIAHTTFHMAHGENEILVLPTFVFALLMLFFWQTIAPLMLISLFFKVHYFFDGTASTKSDSRNRNRRRSDVLRRRQHRSGSRSRRSGTGSRKSRYTDRTGLRNISAL